MKRAFQIMVAAASTSFFISCNAAAPDGTTPEGDTTATAQVDTTAGLDVVPVDTASTVSVDSTAMSVDTMAAVPEPQPMSTSTEARD
jgi:hypothetical protein